MSFYGIMLTCTSSRTLCSFCLGFFAFLPGYIHNITPTIEVAEGWTRLFYMSYPLGYFGTGAIHYAISYFFPPKELYKVDEYDLFGTFAPGEKTPFGMIVGIPTSEERVASSHDEQGDKMDSKTSMKAMEGSI